MVHFLLKSANYNLLNVTEKMFLSTSYTGGWYLMLFCMNAIILASYNVAKIYSTATFYHLFVSSNLIRPNMSIEAVGEAFAAVFVPETP